MPSRASEAAAPRAEGGASTMGAWNLAWADRFVASLFAAGVRDACICPGSRSGPLVLAFDRSPIRAHVALDERSGAYFALGLAKASRRPVAILCTSGTAAANFFPAVVEAYYSRVPLVVATADRPPESRDTGAPQTIDQIKLYGSLVRWFVEVGAPDPTRSLQDYVASLGTRAVAEAWGPPAGPVHLNFLFREPLLPDPDQVPAFPEVAPGVTGSGASHSEAAAAARPEPSPPPRRGIERVAQALRAHRRGLIVCGPDDTGPPLGDAVARLASVLGYPVLADPGSQIRFGPHDRSRILGAYDAFLRSPAFVERSAPEVILQIGAAPTSRAYDLYAARYPETLHFLVDPGRGWRTPTRSARQLIAADPVETVLTLCEALRGKADPLASWHESFRRADSVARATIERRLGAIEHLAEPKIFPEALRAMPESAVLYVGNSMPIRDLDTFVPAHAREVRVLVNRGANGIDGLVSSALGAGTASDAPVLLVTGDLSFHHDLTALHLARDGRGAGTPGGTGSRGAGGAVAATPKATIVIVNNDGGGIFSFLPVARHAAFERYFASPHGLDFAPAVEGYGIPFERPASWVEFRERVSDSMRRRATEVIEVRTDRTANRALHQEFLDEVLRAVERDLIQPTGGAAS